MGDAGNASSCYPQKGDTETSALIRLAWAITLSQYAGSDSVTFSTKLVSKDSTSTAIYRLDLQRTLPLVEQTQKLYQDTEAGRSGDDSDGQWEESTLLEIIETTTKSSTEVDEFYPFSTILTCHVKGSSISPRIAFGTSQVPDWLRPRVLGQFSHILHQIIATPTATLNELDPLNPEDEALVARWNSVPVPPVETTVHDLVRQQALQRPEAPAVESWDGGLTYRQLEELSSNLAIHLLNKGLAGPGKFIPLCFEKTRWAIVATLGVMKAGSAFVPLDPSHPVQRLKDISHQVSAQVIVTSTTNARFCESLELDNVIIIGDDESELRDNDGCLKPPTVGPYDPVYAIFTSGSTGKPKGAVLDHVTWTTNSGPMLKTMELTPESRLFQFSSWAFDVSVGDIFAALLSGGCICIPSDAERKSDLAGAINRLRANVACLTPSVAKLLRPTDVPNLKTVITAGEPMTAAEVETWSDHLTLKNFYGPVETTVYCSGNPRITRQSNFHNIGHPFGGLGWVVDLHDHQRLAPIGAIGELIMEGPLVAQGYLNAPEKTAEVFIKNPSWLSRFRAPDDTLRFYKTGDLVRWTPDGSYEFGARKDTQIKLRGQRIELAEVEYHVRHSFSGEPDVVAGVVKQGENPLLAAFVSCGGEGSDLLPPSDNFRQQFLQSEDELRKIVPPYMVPAIFIPISQIPLTPNGKTDRKKLLQNASALSSEQLGAYSAVSAEKCPPVTEDEVILCRAVAEALGRTPEGIGMEDNFFRLGGDSITAMKLVTVARNEGLQFTVIDLVARPKLCDLASWIKEAGGRQVHVAEIKPFSLINVQDTELYISEKITPRAPLLRRENILDILPMTAMQKYHWRPCTFFQFHLEGELDESRLRKAGEKLAECHSIFRTVFLSVDGAPTQVVLKKVPVDFIRYEVPSGEDPKEFLTQLCTREVMQPVPDGVPSYQLTLVSASETKHTLVMRLDHAQYDGVSQPLMYRDLAALYKGEEVTPTDFRQYLYQAASQKVPEAYGAWKKLLDGAHMSYVGNTDMSVEPFTFLHTFQIFPTVELPIGVTLATMVKAAWTLALSRHVNRSDVVFGQMVNGRGLNLPGVDTLLGACFNTIPVRVKYSPSMTGQDLIQQIQDQHLSTISMDSFDYQDIFEHSTPWGRDARFGSVILHQNMETLANLSFGDNLDGRIEEFFLPRRPREVVIYSIPSPAAHQVHMFSALPHLEAEAWEALLKDALEFFKALAASPEKSLSELMT